MYDTAGRRIGHVRESPLVEGQCDICDQMERRTGRVASDRAGGAAYLSFV